MGYEWFQVVDGGARVDFLMVQHALVIGLNQGLFVPAGNALFGFEVDEPLQVGVGANLNLGELVMGGQLDDERTVLTIQQARVPGHAPPVAKRAMWEAEDRLTALESQRVLLWVNATEAAMLARTVGDDDREAREMIAELWWARMEDMAARGQEREVKLAMHHIIQADPERRGAALLSPCTLSVQVDGGPATVSVQPLVERGRHLVAPDAPTHPVPLVGLELPSGRYQVRVEAEGCPPVQVPVALSRAAHVAIHLRPRSAAAVGEGFEHVPGGTFLLGGDIEARRPMPRCRPTLHDLFVQQHAVTVAEWQAFLDDLSPGEAARRAPGERGVLGPDVPWWSQDDAGRWCPPERWDPRWPIVGIGADDAAAYAAWRSAREGHPLRLPTEEEWEKAARGTDGRAFPWGDRFDPTFAHMRSSRPGLPGLSRVDDFPVDTSPYGVRGMAGGVREWTASWLDAEQVVVRGGSWADEQDDLRCASRRGMAAGARSPMVGFRLVREVVAG
jgi:serine/threonine-protein kinase